MSRDEMLSGLSRELPNAIDELTPAGRLPTEQEASRLGLIFSQAARSLRSLYLVTPRVGSRSNSELKAGRWAQKRPRGSGPCGT
jgi:hypothetical protein